jgi:CheY-like chemotaxis protein
MTLKLFVADDSVTIQKIVGLAFSGDDVSIQAVSTGDSALDEIRAFRPDIVLVDVFMPGCNGYEVCSLIKEDPDLAGIPVVLLVGTFEPFDESEASRVKCDGYLTKPFDTSELVQLVHRLAGEKMAPSQDMAAADASKVLGTVTLSSSGVKGKVNPAVWDSFLGPKRILDLLPEAVSKNLAAPHFPENRKRASAGPAITAGGEVSISEDLLDLIVDKVVKQMSKDVVREVAWEVVPELSEVIIRRSLEERGKS